MPLSRFFYMANMCFNAIHENKMLTKISGFTVLKLLWSIYSQIATKDRFLHNMEAVTYLALGKGIQIVIFFLFLNKNICCGYSLEASH